MRTPVSLVDSCFRHLTGLQLARHFLELCLNRFARHCPGVRGNVRFVVARRVVASVVDMAAPEVIISVP